MWLYDSRVISRSNISRMTRTEKAFADNVPPMPVLKSLFFSSSACALAPVSSLKP